MAIKLLHTPENLPQVPVASYTRVAAVKDLAQVDANRTYSRESGRGLQRLDTGTATDDVALPASSENE